MMRVSGNREIDDQKSDISTQIIDFIDVIILEFAVDQKTLNQKNLSCRELALVDVRHFMICKCNFTYFI